MKPTPAGWPRISPGAHHAVAMGMFEWLSRAFVFGVQLKVVERGRLMHSQLVHGEGLIMVGGALSGAVRRFATDRRSPLHARCNTQNLMLYVDGVDAHCASVRAAGAASAESVAEPEGHLWWVVQRLRGLELTRA